MSRFEFPVLFTPTEKGGFVVTCRDLPEVITQGESLEDAMEQAMDAMDEGFAMRMDDGLDFPEPSAPNAGEGVISPSAETVLKAELHIALREANINKVELANRLGVDEKAVRRMLDPRHPTKLPGMAKAIEVLGKRLVISTKAKAA